jgi:uncharacterized protein YggU (UPF0235/DUF167 family)
MSIIDANIHLLLFLSQKCRQPVESDISIMSGQAFVIDGKKMVLKGFPKPCKHIVKDVYL